MCDSAAANTHTYLLLKVRGTAFHAVPDVRAALATARVDEHAQPTIAGGESINDLLADPSAFENFDAGSYLDDKGFGFVRLQQIATGHLMGA